MGYIPFLALKDASLSYLKSIGVYALVVDNDKGLFELSLKNLTWHYSFELFQAFQSVSICATHGTRKLCHDNVGGLFELPFQEPDLALLSKPLWSISSCPVWTHVGTFMFYTLSQGIDRLVNILLISF